MLNDDDAAQIQAFTSWASAKGYHVVGALIGKRVKNGDREESRVQTFCTAPDARTEKQVEHLKKLVEVLRYTVYQNEPGETITLPLGEN